MTLQFRLFQTFLFLLALFANSLIAQDCVPISDDSCKSTQSSSPLVIEKRQHNSFCIEKSGTYTLMIRNKGPKAINGLITLVDELPTGVQFSSAAGNHWSYQVQGKKIVYTLLARIEAGESAPPLTVNVWVSAEATASMISKITVCLEGKPVASFTDRRFIDTLEQPRLMIKNTRIPSPDGQHIYRLIVGNKGSYSTNGSLITLIDHLPIGTSLISAVGTDWAFENKGDTIICTTTQMLYPGEESSPITLTVATDPTLANTVNRAIVNGGGAIRGAAADYVTLTSGSQYEVAFDSEPLIQLKSEQLDTYAVQAGNHGTGSINGAIVFSKEAASGLNDLLMPHQDWDVSAFDQSYIATTFAPLAPGEISAPFTLMRSASSELNGNRDPMPDGVLAVPAVTTGPATNLSSTSATLNGTIDGDGQATTYYFEYGLTALYGSETPTQDAGSPVGPTAVNATINGLTPNTTYHFQVVATNADGDGVGGDQTFTTLAALPTVVTNPATNVMQTSATLNGTVNPNGSPTTYFFEYGLTDLYGSTVPIPAGDAGSGTDDVAVSNTISGLLPNTTYHYRIVAENAEGTSLGNDQTFTTLPLAPTVVTNLATNITQTGATFNGTVNPNGAPTTYQFQYGLTTAYGSTTPSASAGAGTSNVAVSAAVSGLLPNTTYHFRIVATNAGGTSLGNDQTFTTLPLPPTVVTNLATNITQTGATLNGKVNPNGASTTYQFEYGLTTAYGSTTPSASAGAGSSNVAVSAAISGLLPNTTYHFRIVATNAGGTSLGNDQTFTTLPLPPTVVTNLATNITQTGATLNGTVNPNGAPTTYQFEYGLTTAYGSTTSSSSAGAGSNNVVVSAAVSGLLPNTTYHFRIVAVNAGGTTLGNDQTFTTLSTPPAPTVITIAATNVTQTTATLNGSVNPNGSETIYQFEYGLTTLYGSTTPLTSAGEGTSAINVSVSITDLLPNTTYHFRIIASNVAGTSFGSDQMFTTLLIPPSSPTVVTNHATNVTQEGATLNGGINPNGSETTYHFEYGLTTSYGAATASVSIGDDASLHLVSTNITGLQPSTLYHFRLVASNEGGTTFGNDQTFVTLPAPVRNLKGRHKINEFAAQADLINIIQWHEAQQGQIPIVSYHIYRDADLTKLAAIIPADQALRFEDHNRKKDKTYFYFVVAINQDGSESTPVSVVVRTR